MGFRAHSSFDDWLQRYFVMLGLLGFLIWFVGLALMSSLSVRVVGPLENAAKAGPRRLRFTLSDCFCLIGMVQIWAAGTHTLARMARADLGSTLLFDAFGWFLIVVMWFGVVQRLSSAGVHNAWHRSEALVFIYPLCVLGVIAVPSFLPIAVFGLRPNVSNGPPFPWPLISGIAVIAIVGLMFAAQRLVRAMVAKAEAEAVDAARAEPDEPGRSPFSREGSQRDEIGRHNTNIGKTGGGR